MTLPPLEILLPIMGGVLGISELGIALFKRSKAGAVSKDRHTLGFIWILNVVGFTLGVFLVYQLRYWRFPWEKQICLVGLVVFALGLAVRWYSIVYLGRFFTANVAIAADHRLIDTGPYRWVRHPSYSGALLMVLGFSLCFGNYATLISFMGFTLAGCLWRIHVEEAALQEAFGERYQEYMKRTKRLVPCVY